MFRKVLIPVICSTILPIFAVFAQVPVTSGLVLHLDAGSGFNDNGALPASWLDLSPANNDMVSGSGLAEPTQVPNAFSTGFTALNFDGVDDYFINQNLNSSLSDTQATLFAVRIGNNTRSGPTGANYKAILSIAEDSTFLDEMGLGADWGLHHSSSGNWEFRTHSCYDSLPTNLPVIVSAILGGQPESIEYQVFGDDATQSVQAVGTPVPYNNVNRRILIGGRFHSNTKTSIVSDLFAGSLFEVLVYNRKLSASEEQQVNDYLIQKYYSGTTQTGTLTGDTVCAGEQVYLTYTSPGGPQNLAVTYTDGVQIFNKSVKNGVPFAHVPNPTTVGTYTFNTVSSNTLNVCNISIGGGSSSTANVLVVPAAAADAGEDIQVCPGETIRLGGKGNGSFLWSPADSMNDPTLDSPTVTVLKPTIFRLIVSNQSGCADTDLVSVGFFGAGFDVFPKSKTICKGDTVQLYAVGGDTYEWSPSAGLSAIYINNPVATPDTDITYYVAMKSGECDFATTLPISIKVNPKPQATAAQSNDIGCDKVVAFLSATGGKQYYWFPVGGLDDPNSATPVAKPKKKTKYTVEVTDDNGCVDTASVEVDVNDGQRMIPLPNAFTPNGDGTNDCYEIKVPFPVQSYEFKIFNRWGNCVFKTNNTMDCWNGQFNGKLQDMGTYYYYYKIKTDVCGEMQGQGTIHLLR